MGAFLTHIAPSIASPDSATCPASRSCWSIARTSLLQAQVRLPSSELHQPLQMGSLLPAERDGGPSRWCEAEPQCQLGPPLPYNPSDATRPAGTLTSDYRWPITLCDPNALRAAL